MSKFTDKCRYCKYIKGNTCSIASDFLEDTSLKNVERWRREDGDIVCDAFERAKDKRYTATFSMYVYDIDLKAATKQANKDMKKFDRKKDNSARLMSIKPAPFGVL